MPSPLSIIPQLDKNKAGSPPLLEVQDRAGKPAPDSALGTYGKIASASSPSEAAPDLAGQLVRRFHLQSTARRLMPLEGVAGCLRRRQGGKEFVDVWHLPEVMRAKYGGLQTCSSVWMCPICAAKITERRRLEVRSAIDAWKASGGLVVLATFTVRHNADDVLRPLVKGLLSTLRRMTSGRNGALIAERFGVVGSIRSVEVTYGDDNGWHPHVHSLYFVKPGCEFDLLWIHLRKQWAAGLRLENMKDVTSRGVDLRWANEDAADYVAKMGAWNVEHELSKGPVKLGRSGNVSPVQMLSAFADWIATGGGDTEHEAYRFGALWQTYALAFRGVHQLQWSRGLRALLGLGKGKSDAEVAEEKEALGVLLARLSKKEWALVLHFDRRAELLNVASGGSSEAVEFYLQDLDMCFVGEEAMERRFKASMQDNRTVWDDQREAEAEELGLTRSEYLRWRHGGVDAMATPAPVEPRKKAGTAVSSGVWVEVRRGRSLSVRYPVVKTE